MKHITIKLSKNGSSLIYDKLPSDKTCFDKIKGSTNLPLSHVKGIIYGGTTSTF